MDRFQVMCAEQDEAPTVSTVQTAASTNPSVDFSEPPSESANTVGESATQLEILNLFRTMYLEIQTSGARTGPTNKVYRKTLDNPTFQKNVTSSYFWIHGACGHTTSNCCAKVKGHKVAVTMGNRINVSKAFCK